MRMLPRPLEAKSAPYSRHKLTVLPRLTSSKASSVKARVIMRVRMRESVEVKVRVKVKVSVQVGGWVIV